MTLGRDFEKQDAQTEQLVPHVDVVCCDMKVFENCISEGIGNVPSIQLHHEESKNEQGHDDQVSSTWSTVVPRDGEILSSRRCFLCRRPITVHRGIGLEDIFGKIELWVLLMIDSKNVLQLSVLSVDF